jgi:hypothetical protein
MKLFFLLTKKNICHLININFINYFFINKFDKFLYYILFDDSLEILESINIKEDSFHS